MRSNNTNYSNTRERKKIEPTTLEVQIIQITAIPENNIPYIDSIISVQIIQITAIPENGNSPFLAI